MSPVCKASESKVDPALLLIPDINGFSHYISNSDLAHSQVRIASLLESILESNVLELQVSEIEDDPILFYNFNNTSTINRNIFFSIIYKNLLKSLIN